MWQKTHRTVFLVVLTLMLSFEIASANKLAGKWSGTISAGEYSLPVSAKFSDNSYTISAAEISSSGSYFMSGGSITFTPTSPSGFPSTTMSISLKGNRCTISGTVYGVQGTLTMKRRGGSSAANNPTATPKPAPKATPVPTISAQIELIQLTGRWIAAWEDKIITLDVYADGWATLYISSVGDPSSDLIPVIYGSTKVIDGQMVIRAATYMPDISEQVPLTELLEDRDSEDVPQAVTLPIAVTFDDPLLLIDGTMIPFAILSDSIVDYQIHPEEPDWTEKE